MRRRLIALAVLLVPAALPAAPPAPTIRVSADYPGATPNVLEDTVVAPLFQQIKGAEGVAHIWSDCRDDRATLTVYLKPGADADRALVAVRKRVGLATPVLPDLVKMRGVAVARVGPDDLPVLWLALTSPDGSRDEAYLGNFARLQLRDELTRLSGGRGVEPLGAADRRLRVTLDAAKLAAHKLTPDDVAQALKQQNLQVEPERPDGPGFTLFVDALGRPVEADQLGDVILKATGEGKVVRLRDVGRVEPGAGRSGGTVRVEGAPGVAVVVSGDAAAARRVREALPALRKKLPEGVSLTVALDLSADEALRVELCGPDSASEERMARVAEAAADRLKGLDGVTVAVSEARSAAADLVLRLAPEAVRRQGRDRVAVEVRRRLADVREAVFRLSDPKLDALPPRRFAVTLVAQDVGDAGGLDALADRLTEAAAKVPGLAGAFNAAPRSVPQLYLAIDRVEAQQLGVDVRTVIDTLRAALGGAIGDAGPFGRTWQLRADLPAELRRRPEDLKQLKVRNAEGKMVPLGALMVVRTADGPRVLNQLDGYRTALVTADLAPGADVAAVREAVRKAVADRWDAKTQRVLLWGAGLDEPEDLAARR
jgi:multidrug efflux pump subunit AcrB